MSSNGLLILMILANVPATTADASIDDKAPRMPTVVFRYEGTTVHTLGTAHAQINFNVSKAIEQVSALEGIIVNLMDSNVAFQDGGKNNTSFWEDFALQNHVDTVRKCKHELISITLMGQDVYTAHNRGTGIHHVDKRYAQLIGHIASTFLGIYRVVELEKLKLMAARTERKVDELVFNVNEIRTTMGSHSQHIDAIEHILDGTMKAIDYLTYTHTRMTVVASLVTNAVVHTSNAMAVTEAILQKRLSPLMLPPDQMIEVLAEITQMAELKGYRILARSTADMYQCEVSFITHPEGFYIFVHVPMAKQDDTLHLYRHLPIPIEVNPGEMLTINPIKSVIATDTDRTKFRAIDFSDLADCTKMGSTYMCIDSNFIRFAKGTPLVEPSTCVYHLLTENKRMIQQTCPMSVTGPTEDAIAVSATEFFLMSSYDHQGRITCNGELHDTFSTRHVAHITMPPGCTARTDSHEVTASLDVAVEGKPVAYYWPPPNSAITGALSATQIANFSDSRQALLEIPKIVEQQHLDKLQRLREETRRIEEAKQDRLVMEELQKEGQLRTQTYVTWGLVLLLLLIICVAAYYAHRWYRTNGTKFSELLAWIIPEQLQDGGQQLREFMHAIKYEIRPALQQQASGTSEETITIERPGIL